MNWDEAKQLELEVRRFLAEGGPDAGLLERIEQGLEAAEDSATVGLLTLIHVITRQLTDDPAEVAVDALAAAELLTEAGEADAAAFAEAVGGTLLHRSGAVDAAAQIAVRTLAAIERMPTTEEWASRTAHCLAMLFGSLHAFELASRSSAKALAWPDARSDPSSRLMIETVRGFFALEAAATHPVDSERRGECIEMTQEPLDALAELDMPAAAVATNCIEVETTFLTGGLPDPEGLEALRPLYGQCASSWVAWHELLHGRALAAADRHDEAMERLRSSAEKHWPFGEQAARRELARCLAAVGRTEEAFAELQGVLDDLDAFVDSHVARQATDLAERVDVEKRSASLRERSEQLAAQVAHDHLTGLASRRALDEFLEQPVDPLAPNAVLVCDLDHFKLINDAYGHGLGDDVLVQIGRTFRECLRVGDFIGRYGGEEFVVVMRSGLDGAIHTAERLRRSVEEAPWTEIAEDLRVTVSIGVAVGSAPLSDLLRAADIAVYDAKAQGRNRVVVSADFSGARAAQAPPSAQS